jgi:hypothetical protein
MFDGYAQSRAMFVAVEYGSEWRSDFRPPLGTDLIVVVQQAEECTRAFTRRFVHKVARAVAEGVAVRAAALVLAIEFDLSRLESRCTIASSLIGSFEEGEQSDLRLLAPRNWSECRSNLGALAEALRDRARVGCNVVICYAPDADLGGTDKTAKAQTTAVHVALPVERLHNTLPRGGRVERRLTKRSDCRPVTATRPRPLMARSGE